MKFNTEELQFLYSLKSQSLPVEWWGAGGDWHINPYVCVKFYPDSEENYSLIHVNKFINFFLSFKQ